VGLCSKNLSSQVSNPEQFHSSKERKNTHERVS
jgi:hypothetical protein